MPEPVSAGWLLGAAPSSVAGMGWLALAMQVHARQVWGAAVSPGTATVLRVFGASGLVAALLLCLAADHASMAALVWVMALAGAALLVAFTQVLACALAAGARAVGEGRYAAGASVPRGPVGGRLFASKDTRARPGVFVFRSGRLQAGPKLRVVFFSVFSARFSFSVLAGFFFCSFFLSRPLAIVVPSWSF